MTVVCFRGVQSRWRLLAVQLGYSAGNLGKSVVWTSFESVMLYYLVVIARFPPLAAGALLAGAMVWDSCVDLTIARLADRDGDAARLRRLIVLGAPMCAIGFWLIFSVRAPYAVASAVVICRIGYSLCDVGHNTLLIRVAQTPADAARVSGMRLLFSAAGGGLLALGSGWGLSQSAPNTQHSAFATGATAGAILYVAVLAVALIATRHLPPPPERAEGREEQRRSTRELLRDPSLRRLLCLVAIQVVTIPAFQRALPFFGQMVHADAAWAGTALLAITLGQSLAMPVWMANAQKHAPAVIAMRAYLLLVVAMAGLVIGSGGLAGLAMLALLGAALSGVNLAIWALLTVSVRELVAIGASGETVPVGLFLAALKSSAGVGNLLVACLVAASPSVKALGGGADRALLPASVLALPIMGAIIAVGLLRGWSADPTPGRDRSSDDTPPRNRREERRSRHGRSADTDADVARLQRASGDASNASSSAAASS